VIRISTSHRRGVELCFAAGSPSSFRLRAISCGWRAIRIPPAGKVDRRRSPETQATASVIGRLTPSGLRIAFHVKRVNLRREHAKVLRIAAAPSWSALTRSVPRETLMLAADPTRPSSAADSSTADPVSTETRASPHPLQVRPSRRPWQSGPVHREESLVTHREHRDQAAHLH